MSSRVFRLLFAILVTFAALPSRSVTAQEVSPALVKVVSFPASNNVNELYVSIMGEVERPGTYRLTPSTLKLHSVVRCAHGFTANASSAIKIIRRGRASQTEIFSDKVDSPVLPGDLLLVESKKSNASERNYSDVSAGRTLVTRADFSDAGRRSYIQVALLNVVEYPLVLRLHPDEANASYLVQALGQPIALLANTHIITPDVPRRQSSEAAKKAIQLQDASVIVFEPGKIKKHRLPPVLPSPIDRETALASQFGLNRLGRATKDIRQLDQDLFADEFDTLDPSRQKFGNLLSTPDEQFASETEIPSENAMKLVSLSPTSENIDPQTEESIQVEDELENDEAVVAMSTGSSITIDESFESIEEEQPKFSFIRVLIIFLIVGTLVGAALLLRRILAVDSIDAKDANTTPDVIDVIQMPAPPTAAPRPRIPPKSLLELANKADLTKQYWQEGLTPGSASVGELSGMASVLPLRSENELTEIVLQFDKTKSTATTSANQITSRPTTESPTIPFQLPNFASAKARPAATPEIASETKVEQNPSPTPATPAAPLAKALFELERGRRS